MAFGIALLDRPLPDTAEGAGQGQPPWDILIHLALALLRDIEAHNASISSPPRKFRIRIGLNHALDNLVVDINKRPNLAGGGINTCQRVMSLGDEGHVLLAEGYYNLIRSRERYRDQLKRHETHLKGAQGPMAVYQLLGDHIGLRTEEPTRLAEERRTHHFLRSADFTSLSRIFCSRADAAQDVMASVTNATRRVWLLGVTLSSHVDVANPRVVSVLKEHVTLRRDLRILLLDPLRSPAVFRCLLEASGIQASALMEWPRPRPQRVARERRRRAAREEDPYFSQPLYGDFYHTFTTLDAVPELWPHVRYYAHLPQCWLVICDDIAYFSPSFLGTAEAPPGSRRRLDIGVPVFTFGGREERPMFRLLVNHFERLWTTSDVDLFHGGLRIEDRDLILADTFSRRTEWLNNAFRVVHLFGGDRRRFTRLPCKYGSDDYRLSIVAGLSSISDVELVNYSRHGVSVSLGERRIPEEAEEISLKFDLVKRLQPAGLQRAVRYLEGLKFQVAWHKAGVYGLSSRADTAAAQPGGVGSDR